MTAQPSTAASQLTHKVCADPPQPLGSPAAPIEAYTPSAPGLPSAGSLADARLSQQRSGSLLAQPPPYVPEPVRPPAASPQPQPPSWALHVPSPVQGKLCLQVSPPRADSAQSLAADRKAACAWDWTWQIAELRPRQALSRMQRSCAVIPAPRVK